MGCNFWLQHAENLDSCSKEYAEKIETKLAEASQNFTSEIQKLKANLKSPAGSPMAHVAQAQVGFLDHQYLLPL